MAGEDDDEEMSALNETFPNLVAGVATGLLVTRAWIGASEI